MSSDDNAVLSFRDVSVQRGQSTLVRKVAWRVAPEEKWVILGPNGAGKTTLLQIAAAQMHPSSGHVSILGEELGAVNVFELRDRIGISSAAVATRINSDEKVRDVVLTASHSVVGRHSEKYSVLDLAQAEAMLHHAHVAQLAERRYGTLSEGERKRVQIARALMNNPELLLLDEPAAGLDLAGREELLRYLNGVTHSTTAPALVMVTHHVEEIPTGVTHVLLLSHGDVVASGPIRETLTAEHLSTTFDTPLALHVIANRYVALTEH